MADFEPTTVEGFQFELLPIYVARKIWRCLSLRDRIACESVASWWQWPNMPYDDIHFLEVDIAYDNPGIWDWLVQALKHVGAYLTELSILGEHVQLIRVPRRLKLSETCPILISFNLSNLTSNLSILRGLGNSVLNLKIDFVKFESREEIAAGHEEIAMALRQFHKLIDLSFYAVVRTQRSQLQDLIFPNLKSATWKGHLRPDLATFCGAARDLRGLDISCSDYDSLLPVTNLASLKHLFLAGTKLNSTEFAEICKRCLLLECVDVSYCSRLTDFSCLTKLIYLESLLVQRNLKFDDEAVGSGLNNGSLRKLQASHTAVTVLGLEFLLLLNPRLQELAFSAVKINPVLALNVLLKGEHLEHLRLEGPVSPYALVPFLQKRQKVLQTVALTKLSIETDEDIPEDAQRCANEANVQLLQYSKVDWNAVLT